MQLERWNREDGARFTEARPSGARDTVVAELVEVGTSAGGTLRLDALDATVAEYMIGAHAGSVPIGLAGFRTLVCQRRRTAMPASSHTLARYLANELGRKASTIRRARIAIGVVHGLAGAPRPDRDPRVRVLERGIGRAHGTREVGPDPLVVEHLARLVVRSCVRSGVAASTTDIEIAVRHAAIAASARRYSGRPTARAASR